MISSSPIRRAVHVLFGPLCSLPADRHQRASRAVVIVVRAGRFLELDRERIADRPDPLHGLLAVLYLAYGWRALALLAGAVAPGVVPRIAMCRCGASRRCGSPTTSG
jgi:hypothetical protein